MPTPLKRLVIDCLIFQKNKAFGYQEYLFNILHSFYKNRGQILFDEIILVCMNKEISNFIEFSDKICIKGFNITNKLKQIYVQNSLKRLLGLTKDDVILYTYNYGAIISQCKSVLVIHDLLFLRKEYLPNWMMRIQRRLFVPISLKKANKVIAISNFTKNDIVRKYHINTSKINTVYNFFNFKKFELISIKDMNEVIKKPFILTISSLGKHKNIIVILKAFNGICKKESNYKLIFVGSFSKMFYEHKKYYEGLDDSVKAKIVFMENISYTALGILYKRCSVFILPTLFEGLGMPIVEALYFNAPTLVSNIEVCREVSLNRAIYFNPESYEELFQIIEKYNYNFPRPNIQKEIMDVFSEEKTSLEYINIINTI
jgi:glycosyltransferase involved in cell wall biosynthesis